MNGIVILFKFCGGQLQQCPHRAKTCGARPSREAHAHDVKMRTFTFNYNWRVYFQNLLSPLLSKCMFLHHFFDVLQGRGNITRVQFSEGPPPKIWEGEKTCLNTFGIRWRKCFFFENLLNPFYRFSRKKTFSPSYSKCVQRVLEISRSITITTKPIGTRALNSNREKLIIKIV